MAKAVGPRHRLVLDANILLRCVMGNRVRGLLESYEETASFYSPDICFHDARRYLPQLGIRRGFNPAAGLNLLEQLETIVRPVDRSLYEAYEPQARARMESKDMEDWPVAAAALLLNCPIWTEDRDFFGSGIATWTTSHVELYLTNR